MFLCIFCTLIFFLTTTLMSMNGILPIKVGSEVNHFLLVDTEGCKIPKLDPFDSSIYWYLTRGSELKCDVEKDITYANGDRFLLTGL